jgi:hypothetical protein
LGLEALSQYTRQLNSLTSTIICAKIDSKSIVSDFYLLLNPLIESSMKVFNTYMQFCGLAYWGPTGGPPAPKQSAKDDHPKTENGTNGTQKFS